MSTQRGNVKKSGPPKHQNKRAWKNVYHDTSKQTQKIVATEVAGVCVRCKDVIDWKIKYKKYKPLSQLKTCAICKKKAVKLAYHTYCQECSTRENKCAKCGEKKDIVQKPSLSSAEQAQQDSEFEMELKMLPERKRRTFLRLQEKGLLPRGDSDDDEDVEEEEEENEEDCVKEQVTAVSADNNVICRTSIDARLDGLSSSVQIEERVDNISVTD